MRRRVALAVGTLLFTGCATRHGLYAWGSYEELIYSSYEAPGKIPPESEVDILEQDYQKARATSRALPPGWHAHLGYLYYQLGKPAEARREFETEKAQFPESAVFMNRLLANVR